MDNENVADLNRKFAAVLANAAAAQPEIQGQTSNRQECHQRKCSPEVDNSSPA
jgi:hypothetical protein